MTPCPSLSSLRGLCHRCARSIHQCRWRTIAETNPTMGQSRQLRKTMTTFSKLRSFRAPSNPTYRTMLSRRAFHASLPFQEEAVDHYETLGLTPDATAAEVKKCVFFHPLPGDCTDARPFTEPSIASPKSITQTTIPMIRQHPHAFSGYPLPTILSATLASGSNMTGARGTSLLTPPAEEPPILAHIHPRNAAKLLRPAHTAHAPRVV